MAPGVLFVASSTLEDGKLSGEDFCDWYENTHIQEVTALSGVTGAVRYQAIDGLSALGQQLPWLTLYEMPDLNFKDSAEFKGLDGQSKPDAALLERIFKHARFDTRFLELVVDHQIEGGNQGMYSADLREDHLEKHC
jgi:hypothetical protein